MSAPRRRVSAFGTAPRRQPSCSTVRCVIQLCVLSIQCCGADENIGPTSTLYSQTATYLPDCEYKNQPTVIEDLTALLKAELRINDTCICNPGLVRLVDDDFLISVKIYWSAEKDACVTSPEPGGSWYEWWKGHQGYALAVLRRPPHGRARVLSHRLVRRSNMEDARLFKDQNGKIRMMFNRHFRIPDALRVSMHVAEVHVQSGDAVIPYIITVTNERDLIYLNQGRQEKNWVPWEGTTLATYPIYPSFGPHSVLDWQSYDEPQMQLDLALQSPIPFLEKLMKAKGGWIRFSGGTPGIRMGNTFVAVGHIVGDMTCFHKLRPAVQAGVNTTRALRTADGGGSLTEADTAARAAWSDSSRSRGQRDSGLRSGGSKNATTDAHSGGGRIGRTESANASGPRRVVRGRRLQEDYTAVQNYRDQDVSLWDHACNSSKPAPGNSGLMWQHHYRGHKLPRHHRFWDYFFFIYSWDARPPHQITHMSHAFIPYDAEDHSGVHYPSGLQLNPQRKGEAGGPSLLLSYGRGDDRVMTMELSAQMLEEYLMPLEGLEPGNFKFCTVGSRA